MCPGAPQMIPRHLVSKEASIALDLARSLARDPGDGLGKGVFFSDVTFWLDRQGKDWRDLGIDYEAVINELAGAPVPQLYMTLSQKAHAILCDARGEVEGAGVVGHRGTFRRAAFSSAALNGADIHVPKRCQTAAAGVSSLHATGNCVRFGSDYQGGAPFRVRRNRGRPGAEAAPVCARRPVPGPPLRRAPAVRSGWYARGPPGSGLCRPGSPPRGRPRRRRARATG